MSKYFHVFFLILLLKVNFSRKMSVLKLYGLQDFEKKLCGAPSVKCY